MNFRFHPEALREFKAAARYYAGRRPGLEQRFIGQIDAAIELICAAPASWGFLEGEVRRCLTRVFPYAVLYTIESDHVLIVAVMHSRRRPGYGRERLPTA